MKSILMLAFIIFAGWKFYTDKQVEASKSVQSQQVKQVAQIIQSPIKKRAKKVTEKLKFECDGRQYCSQMTSCAEATYFIQHCPDPKMDGDSDGVPCERQWCN